MEFKHVPIMLDECVLGLNIKEDGVYVDATIGGAGHSIEIAKRLNQNGVLIGIDKDETAVSVSKQRLKDAKCKVIIVHDDFRNIKSILENLNIKKVDGILADLGVSSYQIDEASRGFSYNKDAGLDMRMDKTSSLDAEKVVNTYSEKDLVKILFEYGEERYARQIVRNIIKHRQIKPIKTTLELRKIIEESVPSFELHKGGSVAKKTFQALRIEVNHELDALGDLLDNMIELLNKNGRICIITFHSLEDRLVKNKFSVESRDCICDKSLPICVCHHRKSIKIITKKPIVPGEEELKLNSRSSSSKLRIAEKI